MRPGDEVVGDDTQPDFLGCLAGCGRTGLADLVVTGIGRVDPSAREYPQTGECPHLAPLEQEDLDGAIGAILAISHDHDGGRMPSSRRHFGVQSGVGHGGALRVGHICDGREMNHPIAPSSVAAPAANYELAVVSSPGSRLIHTSGIVGTRPDGSISDDIGEQATEMWRTIGVILSEAGFAIDDIVSYHTYAVIGHDLSAVMAARDAFFDGHRAASTLIPVPALARPHWLVEAAVIAAS